MGAPDFPPSLLRRIHWIDGLTAGLAVADHVGCRSRFCKQEDKKERVNEVDTWQVGLNSSAQVKSSGVFC
jgi:hypothetical protein